MKNSKKIFAFTLVLAALITGAVFAFPQITLTAQNAGEGEAQVAAPINAASINFDFDANYQNVTAIEIVPAQSLDAGAVIVVNILDNNGNIAGHGTTTLQNAVNANGTATVPLDNPVANASVFTVHALVVGPKY